MPYEAQVAQLARCELRHHGQLKEVVCLGGNKDSLLVFADGTVIAPANDQSLEHEYDTYDGYGPIAQQLGGTHPYSLLAFGYQGTGPQCFAAFLRTAGFTVEVKDMESVVPPARLRPDGSWVRGTKRDGSLQWEDGTETPQPRGPSIRPAPEAGGVRTRESILAEAEKSSGCFIATACYGLHDCEEVLILRRFRDTRLLRSGWERIAVAAYCRISPAMARLLHRSPTLRHLVRNVLVRPSVALIGLLEVR